MLSSRSRTSPSPDALRTDEASLLTPSGEYDRDPVDHLFTSASTTTPSVQNSTGEAFTQLAVQPASVVEGVIGDGPPEYVSSTKNERFAGPESTSAAGYPPSVHFTLRPEFESLFGVRSSCTHSEQLSPMALHLTSMFPAAGDFAGTKPTTTSFPDEFQIIPTTQPDSASQHKADDIALISYLPEEEEAIELVSPMVFEAQNNYRRSPGKSS